MPEETRMPRGSGLKHNKKRDVGLVYRQLVKCLSESMVTKDTRRGEATLTILRKYFSEGSPLSQELALHRVVQENRGVEERIARRVVDDVIRESQSLDHRVHDIKKSALIRDINYNLGQDFFDRYRIPEYRAIASTHLLISCRPGVLSESVDRAKLEESVVRYMTAAPQTQPTAPGPERNRLALKMAIEAFNREFSGLTVEQKSLLNAYVVGSVKGDYTRFRRIVESRLESIRTSLSTYLLSEDVRGDQVFKERMEQVRQVAASIRPDHDPSQVLEDVMMLQELVDEIGRK